MRGRWRLGVWKRRSEIPTHQSTQDQEDEDSSDPFLDIQEQEKLITSFEISNRRQNLIWRGTIAMIGICIGLYFASSAYQQTVSPWSIKYHALLMDSMDSFSIICADVVEAAVYMLAVLGLILTGSWGTKVLQVSLTAGAFVGFFWLWNILRLSIIPWHIIWLPLGGSSFAALCLYLDGIHIAMLRDIENLRAYMYHYKKA